MLEADYAQEYLVSTAFCVSRDICSWAHWCVDALDEVYPHRASKGTIVESISDVAPIIRGPPFYVAPHAPERAQRAISPSTVGLIVPAIRILSRVYRGHRGDLDETEFDGALFVDVLKYRKPPTPSDARKKRKEKKLMIARNIVSVGWRFNV